MKRHMVMALTAMTVMATAWGADQASGGRAQARPEVRMGTMPEELILTKITVADLNRSYDFYTKVVGLKAVSSPDIPISKLPQPGDPEKAFIEIPLNFSGSMADPMFLLIKRRGVQPTPEGAGLVWIGFKVPSITTILARAAQLGIQPTRPFNAEGGMAFLRDPDGYNVELVQTPSFQTR